MPTRRRRAPRLAALAALLLLSCASLAALAQAGGADPASGDRAAVERIADALLGGDSAMDALRGRALGNDGHELAVSIPLVPHCRTDARRAVVCSAPPEPRVQAEARHTALAAAVENALRPRGWSAEAEYRERGVVRTRVFRHAQSRARISVRLSARPEGQRVWLFADRAAR